MIPDRTSPVPAVARRASPVVTRNARPSLSAITGVAPFNSTVAFRRSGQRPCRLDAIGTRRVSHEPLVLAVVRREHGERMRVEADVGTERGETVAVHDGGHRRLEHDALHRRCGGRIGSEARSDDQRLEPAQPFENVDVPPDVRDLRAHDLDRHRRAGVRARTAEPDVPRAGALARRPRRARPRRPSRAIRPRSRSRRATCACRAAAPATTPPHRRLRRHRSSPTNSRGRCRQPRSTPRARVPGRRADRASARRTSPWHRRAPRPARLRR